MSKLLVRAGLPLVGVFLLFAWWTYGPKDKQIRSEDRIPTKVGDGGQKLYVEAESTSVAVVRVSFEQLDKPVGQQRLLESWEKIPAGSRSWNIDVPSGVGGYIELEADHPKVGDKITMRVRVNGNLVDEQTDSLDKPLEPNTAFFVQDHFDDYSRAAQHGQQE